MGGEFRSRRGVSSWARRSSYIPSQIDGYPSCTAFRASIDRHSPIRYTESGLIAHVPRVQETASGLVLGTGGHALLDQLAGHRSVSVVLMLVSTFSPRSTTCCAV